MARLPEFIHDNRGTTDEPFGRIYHRDGWNCGYGGHRDDPRPLALWPTAYTPDDLPRDVCFRLGAYIRSAFPHLADR